MQHFASGKRYAAGFPACSRRKTSDESVAVPNELFSLPANVGMAGALKRRTVRVMKLTTVLLTLAFLQVQAHGLGQEVTLNVKQEKLEKVLSLIEKQTGYVFFTTADLLKKARPVTIQVRNEALSRALDLCFKGQVLDYVIQGKTISVVERKAVPVSNPISINTDQIKKVNITGRVVNENDEPVAGATVMVKGSTYATATDEKGEFRLEEIEENSTLIITGANIETNEVKIRGRENVAIKVQSKVAVNEAVVVTVNTGYQNIPKERATGSFVKIDNKLLNRRVSTDILSRIDGIASGVLFDGRNSTLPLENVSIRGMSTINGNSQPLIVIDNFPYTGDINTINPNDIESITILKDAASASVWGAFSGNGVIVITTKKGKYNQQAKVNFNSNVTVFEKPNLFYDQQFIGSSNFIDIESFLFSKGFYDDDLLNTNGNYTPVSPIVDILSKQRDGFITNEEARQQIDVFRKYDIRNDYSNYFYRKGINQQYAINLQGGSEKATYYLSGGYDKNLASLNKNNNDRISFNALLTFNPISLLEISGGIVFTQSASKTNGMSSISAGGKYQTIYPYAQFADNNGSPLSITKDYSHEFVNNPGVPGLLNWSYIPLNELTYADNSSKLNDNRLTAEVKYTILKGFNIQFKYQYQKGVTEGSSYFSPETYYVRNLINTYTEVSGNEIVKNNIPLGGILTNSTNTNASNAGRLQLNYTNTWNKHSISAIGGIDAREVKTEGHYSQLYGYDINTGTYQSVDYVTFFNTFPSGTFRIPNGNGIIPNKLARFRSYFGNTAYTFLNRYTVSGSIRLDQANLFGVKTNQKGKPMWSAGASWDITKESFYQIKWLSLLKLRTTYGFNGNIDNSITAITTAIYNNGDAINNAPYASINTPGNPQLRWEKIGVFNVGVDFELNKNVVSGSIEFYHKKGVDMIGRTIIPSSTGFLTTKGNFSSMTGNGIDLTLTTRNINRKLKWETTFLFSKSTDKITKNEGDENKRVGKPVNAWYTFKWGGLDAAGDPLGFLNDTLSKDYNAIINAANTNPELRKYSGSSTPTIWGSIRNSLTFKNISISANIVYKGGYYFSRSSIDYGSLFNTGRGHADYAKRWQKPGDEQSTNVPALVYIDHPNFSARNAFYTASEVLIEKGDHLRLQDISFSYGLTKRNFSKLPFESIEFYFYANNLGILWRANNQNIDPNDPTGYPLPKSYSMGCRFGL